MKSFSSFNSKFLILFLCLLSLSFFLFAAGQQEEAGSVAIPEGSAGKYTQPVVLTSVRYLPTITEYRPGDDIYNNVWTREIEDKLGVKIEYDWVVEQTQYANKLNLTIAAGDLPDFFPVDNANFVKLANAGQLADLDSAYNNYASPELKTAMDAFPQGFQSGVIDGVLRGLSGQHYGTLASLNTLWMRSDWLTKYNLDPPQTMDDLENIAKVFMKGESANTNNVFGISLYRDLYGAVSSIAPIANAYHAYPQMWVRDSNDKIVYGSIQPEMRNALKVMANWFEEGLLSEEFGVKDMDSANADLVAGRVGIEFGAQWNGWYPFVNLVQEDPTAVFKPYPVPASDLEPVKLGMEWPVFTMWGVNDDCKNPEAVIKMANLYIKYQWHGTDEEYTNFIDGGEFAVQRMLSPIEIIDPSQEEITYKGVANALSTGDTSQLTVASKAFYENSLLWKTEQDPSGYGRYIQMSDEGSYAAIQTFLDKDQIMVTELSGADPPIWAKYKSILSKLEKDVFTRVILGADISEFDKFVEDWNELGGNDATLEINAMFNSN